MKVSDVQVNQGIIDEIDGREVAAVNLEGQLMIFENTCTHRQCPIAWNASEATWDCPCHGSRFSADGQVIAGPARLPLQSLSFKIVDGEVKLQDD
jgi:Rieske Fe-S protein